MRQAQGKSIKSGEAAVASPCPLDVGGTKLNLPETCCSGELLATQSPCVISMRPMKLSQKSETFSSEALNAKATTHVRCVAALSPLEGCEAPVSMFLAGQQWWARRLCFGKKRVYPWEDLESWARRPLGRTWRDSQPPKETCPSFSVPFHPLPTEICAG